MAIRFMRAEGSMPNESKVAHEGKNPSLSHSDGTATSIAPGAPPSAPSMKDIIPWMVAQMLQATAHPQHEKTSSMETMQPAMGEKLHTQPNFSHGLPNIGTMLGDSRPQKSYKPQSAVFVKKSAVAASILPKSQGLEKVDNPHVVPPGVEPISRAIDNKGRDQSLSVARGALDQGAKSSLIRPKERVYAQKKVQQYALKRPLG